MNKIFYILFAFAFLNGISYSQDSDYTTHDSLKIDYNYINSLPQNAELYINDEYIGNTPKFFIWGDSVFPKRLTVKKNGYADFTETFNDASFVNKTYSLVPLSGTKPPLLVKQDMSTHFHSPRKVVPIVLTGLVTAGAGFAAFWYKSLAIENRDHYNEYNDQQSLDNKKKYDIISGVSIAAFQLGFGALMYFLFID